MEKCHYCDRNARILKYGGMGEPICELCAYDTKLPPPEKKIPVPGRNEPCSCGSGLKYKKCCLTKIDHLQNILT